MFGTLRGGKLNFENSNQIVVFANEDQGGRFEGRDIEQYLNGSRIKIYIMQKLKVIIERAEMNYSAYIEACKDFGYEVPEELASDYEMSFEMDTQTLLVYYAGVFGKPALEKNFS